MSTLILQQKQETITFVQKIESVIAKVQLWMDRHHQRKHLATLDMSQLQDMGLSLYQIDQEIRKPFWK